MTVSKLKIRENKMAGKKKFNTKNSKPKIADFMSLVSCALVFALFVCTFLPGGCTPTTENENIQTPGVGKVTQTLSEEKKQELLKTVQRRFENPQAHYELGQIYRNEGLLVSAEYHYNTALRFDPVHREAQAAMVKMLTDSGETAKAKQLAVTYMGEVSSSAAGARRLGLAFQKEGLDEYALACYQEALRLEPSSAESYKLMGYYYLSKNDKVLAREYLSRSFELKRNQPDVALTLGQLGVEIKIPQQTEIIPEQPKEAVEGSKEKSGGQ
jgi:tetratricopeptide (TPR) repeat protein